VRTRRPSILINTGLKAGAYDDVLKEPFQRLTGSTEAVKTAESYRAQRVTCLKAGVNETC